MLYGEKQKYNDIVGRKTETDTDWLMDPAVWPGVPFAKTAKVIIQREYFSSLSIFLQISKQNLLVIFSALSKKKKLWIVLSSQEANNWRYVYGSKKAKSKRWPCWIRISWLSF